MKRFLCPRHAYLLKTKARPVQLSTPECSVCRWTNRRWTLKDVAVELRNVADLMEFCFEDEHYDPFGITFIDPFEEVVFGFLKSIHSGYRDNFLKKLNEAVK